MCNVTLRPNRWLGRTEFRPEDYTQALVSYAKSKGIPAPHPGKIAEVPWRTTSRRLGDLRGEPLVRHRELSRKLGLVVRAIEFTDGSLAVDVDYERTYRVCEELLAKREARSET